MPRGHEAVDQGRSQVGTSMLTQVRMPQLAPRMTTHENLSSVDRGFLSCARGPLETQASEEGQVDLNLIIKRGGYYQYLRDNGYPKHFPLDEHLFPFIQRFTLNDPDADNAAVILEREQLELAILSGRDSIMGTCTFSYLSFPPDYPASIQFPDVEQLGFFGSVTDSVTKALTIVPAFWEVYGLPKSGFSFLGLSQLPSSSAYTLDDYSQSQYRVGTTDGQWFHHIDSALGPLNGSWVLHHYHDLLDHVGIRHAVTAALYSYPCHAGLLQALAERFNRRFNTFATAKGETSIDLWAFHRISGLPICGSLYEEVCQDDLHRDNSKGKGSYHTPYSLRYLTKVWRDLARAGKDETPSACKSSVRVDRHLVAASWWCYYIRRGPPLGCVLPDAERSGQVDIYYARWWFRHSNVFREQLDRIKEAEEKRLCRVDLSSLALSSAFLKQKFPAVDRSLHGSRRKKEGSQKAPLTEKHAYTEAMKPLERSSISGLKDKQSLPPQKHYSWWLHLLSDCGYPANAALSSPILPDGYTNDLWPHWEQHLKNSIARVGPVEFISQLDNCTRLQDLWDAISKAGKVVKLDPKAVVLPPSFSPIPDASYVSEPVKKKPSSPRPKKRRAARAGGASKRVAQERTIEDPLPEEPAPSDAVVEGADFGAQNDEGIGDMETDDYHHVRDGAPSSDEEDTPAADDPGRGDVETNIGVNETPIGSDDQDDLLLYDENMSASFQELHDLLEIEVDLGLPEYQEGTATGVHDTDWTEILQNATIITSGAEMPGFPTLEEGELPREIVSEGNGSAPVGSDPAHSMEGAISGDLEIPPHDHLGGELTGVLEQSQPVINAPSQGYEIVEGAIIGENSVGSGGAATGGVSMVDDTVGSSPTRGVGADVEASEATCFATGGGDGGAVIGAASHCEDSAPSASQEIAPSIMAEQKAVFIQRFSLPPHGIVWPDDTQTGSARGLDFMAESFIRSIRSIMEAEFPPPIDEVSDRMKTSTKAYHLMGLPRDPWMASIDSLWAEVQDLHAKSAWESVGLQICQLGGDISALENQLAGAYTREATIETRQAELDSSSTAFMEEVSLLEQAIERASIRLAELRPVLAVMAEDKRKVAADREASVKARLALEHELAAKKSVMEDLQMQISSSS
ncbi:hypothetical protein Taro_016800 [Colocasia esculenta]|uniref:Aminotransferase-like plant mobile domain-containing protein n=1 Tax=Colocasia esculenta TaxID=4460 RepID=A0A843URD0_COLES|nr:hypothetical protein [Colocasia esculenta]